MVSNRTQIVCTLGDPTSIGPEVGCRALSRLVKKAKKPILLFAPESVLSDSVLRLVRQKKIELRSGKISNQKFIAGKPSLRSAARALSDLEAAIEFCKKNPKSVLVTGPLDKAWCSRVLSSFTGHTDLLRERTKSKFVTMVLAGPHLKVALATTHLPLSQVSRALSQKKIETSAQQFYSYLSLSRKKPRLAVLGLNPHASDRGVLGGEEQNIIEPAIRALKKHKLNVEGPFPADSFFHRKAADFDGVLAMYHDQGLIPLKMLDFDSAVNITLGLPFLRVSVDHGTAFDIAGRDVASSKSYEEALKIALENT